MVSMAMVGCRFRPFFTILRGADKIRICVGDPWHLLLGTRQHSSTGVTGKDGTY